MSISDETWSERAPLLMGNLHGLALAFGGLFLMGALPIYTGYTPLLVVSIFGFRKPISYQAALLMFPVMMEELYRRPGIMAQLLPLSIALILANLLIPMEIGKRFGTEHGSFIIILTVSCAILFLPFHGFAASFWMISGTLGILGFVFACVYTVYLGKQLTSPVKDEFGRIERRLP